jgi:hypothetical protein
VFHEGLGESPTPPKSALGEVWGLEPDPSGYDR